VRFIIYNYVLIYDVKEEFAVDFFLSILNTVINHFLGGPELAMDVSVTDLVNLSVLTTVDVVNQALWLLHKFRYLFHLLVLYLVLSVDYMDKLQVLFRELLFFISLLSFLFGLYLNFSDKHIEERLVDEVKLYLIILGPLSIWFLFFVKNETVRHLI